MMKTAENLTREELEFIVNCFHNAFFWVEDDDRYDAAGNGSSGADIINELSIIWEEYGMVPEFNSDLDDEV
jgi:hypothetical protein